MDVERRHKRWLLVGAFFLLGGFGVIAAQLFELQVVRHEELQAKARRFFERTYVKASRRGDIRDVRGNLLATSKEVRTVCADPSVIDTNYVEIARALAPLLDMSAAELVQKLKPRMVTNSAGKVIADKYVVLKRKVEVERWDQITNTMANLKFAPDEKKLPKKIRDYYARVKLRALMSEQDEERVYPNGTLAAHVIGFAGIEERQTVNGPVLMCTGSDGLELTLNSMLNGVNGWVQTETDSARREMVAWRDQTVAPREGLDAYLTIDAGVQHIVESAIAEVWEKHSPNSVSAAVVRPRTGEILALANLPTFNPNSPGEKGITQENRRNRFVQDCAEPGSTFKVVVVSGAINDHLATLHEEVDCENGTFFYCGKYLHDTHHYGLLPVELIIAKSSNIGAAKMGIRMGPQRLYDYIRGFGFGQITGIPLPGESPGILHPLKKWNGLSISRIPMGQGIATTPLQTLLAMSAIANDGVLMKPMLVSKLVDRSGVVVAQNEPRAVRRVISSATARDMVQALKSVVSTNGTGAKVAIPFYTIAGKTGTAQKPEPGGYSSTKFFSSFIGFFPADRPELAISVVVDEPKHGHMGADVAGPVFRQIAERSARYLAIPMEAPVQPQTAAQPPKQTLAVIAPR